MIVNPFGSMSLRQFFPHAKRNIFSSPISRAMCAAGRRQGGSHRTGNQGEGEGATLNRPGFAVFTMTKVVERRMMSAPADTTDDFIAFGSDLLLKAGFFPVTYCHFRWTGRQAPIQPPFG
jgi:hypothetical protein